MTTARTSNLIVRETEAEDQRRITIALSTLAPDDHEALFEQSVTLVASLLWQLSQKSYPLASDRRCSGFGTGFWIGPSCGHAPAARPLRASVSRIQ